jgi:hypothetical protein
VRLEGLGKLKKSTSSVGNPATFRPQPTTLPRAPILLVEVRKKENNVLGKEKGKTLESAPCYERRREEFEQGFTAYGKLEVHLSNE